MKTHLRPALASLVVLTLLTGFIYPALVTALAQVIFPKQANGSLIVRDGKPVGSSLVGQGFDAPRYFWGRLSATSPVPYTAFNSEKGTGSSGSNLGPLNPALHSSAESRVKALREADPGNSLPIPVDLVTASGSGLDPDISLEAAAYQVPRVARARRLSEDAVRKHVAASARGPQLGMLGESRVNVLDLNLSLDSQAGGGK